MNRAILLVTAAAVVAVALGLLVIGKWTNSDGEGAVARPRALQKSRHQPETLLILSIRALENPVHAYGNLPKLITK